MKYEWTLRKYWWYWFKTDIIILFYKLRYGFKVGKYDTLMPETGKGKYVSVYRKGDIIQIIDETGKNNEIRIIPYQPNHGVMIEVLKNGKIYSRNTLDIEQLNKSIIYHTEIEKLTNKNDDI